MLYTSLKPSRRPVNISTQPNIFVSESARFSLTGSGFFHVAGRDGQNDIWIDALSHTSGHGTLFPLHDSCLSTSCRAIEHHQSKRKESEEESTLEVLVRLLNSRFIERQGQYGSVGPVNDLFNLSSPCSVYGPRSVLALTKLEWWGGGYDVSLNALYLSIELTLHRGFSPILLSGEIPLLLCKGSCKARHAAKMSPLLPGYPLANINNWSVSQRSFSTRSAAICQSHP
jgi:hypothetical protein